jgi:hypothetical protein
MNWTEALTACGFTSDAKNEHGDPNGGVYHLVRGRLCWTVAIYSHWRDERYTATLEQSVISEARAAEMARAEADTADRAFMALLNEKVGPGGVRVFSFIGADRSPAVAFARHVEELKMAGKCAAQVRIPIEELTGSDGAMVSPVELLSIAAAKLRENQGDE